MNGKIRNKCIQNDFSWEKIIVHIIPQIQVPWERNSNIFYVFPQSISHRWKSKRMYCKSFRMYIISIIFALEFYNCSQWVEQQIRTEQNQLTRKDNQKKKKMYCYCEWLHHYLLARYSCILFIFILSFLSDSAVYFYAFFIIMVTLQIYYNTYSTNRK